MSGGLQFMTFHPLRRLVNQPSSSHAFPVLVRQLDCSHQRTQWNMPLLKVHQWSLSFTETSSPPLLLFWLLRLLVSPYTPAACPAIWRSLASCLSAWNAAPCCPSQSSLSLIFVIRHVAELPEQNNTKSRVSSEGKRHSSQGVHKHTSKHSNHPENWKLHQKIRCTG